MASLSNDRSALACGLMSCALLGACVSSSDHLAAGYRDLTYLHCRGARGDFSISDRHRSIRQYSARAGGYVSLCQGCTVAEWDDRILLHDSHGTFIAIDRISGEIQVQRGMARSSGADARAYHGTCKLGARVGPNEVTETVARAF